jgi:hypothetical protein
LSTCKLGATPYFFARPTRSMDVGNFTTNMSVFFAFSISPCNIEWVCECKRCQ